MALYGDSSRSPADFEAICARQQDEIESLKELLQSKDKELESLNRILQKYANIIPELRNTLQKPDLDAGGNKKIEDFWDVDGTDSTQVNFEDIASKGLWILSSVQQSKGLIPRIKPSLRHNSDRRKADSVPLDLKTSTRKGLKLGDLVKPAGPIRHFPHKNGDQNPDIERSFRVKRNLNPGHRKANSLLGRVK